MMYYYYKETVITVHPGLGLNNFATCYLKHTGNWKSVQSPDMPRVERFDTAVNNLHAWAKKKKLKRADCGCCMFCSADGFCSEYQRKLSKICTDFNTKVPVYHRDAACNMMERNQKTGVA